MKKFLSFYLISLCGYSWGNTSFKEQNILDFSFYAQSIFEVQIVPHPLSMTVIQPQAATANINFYYDLKKAISYYDENKALGFPAKGVISSEDLKKLNELGLSFNTEDLSITGIPNKMGAYTFEIGAINSTSKADCTAFTINVGANPQEKPVFKKSNTIASAIPTLNYRFNLMNLLIENPGFMVTNQISFRIKEKEQNAEWLHISKTNLNLLEGTAPLEAAGKEVEVTLIASSNLGGDSEPKTIKIPIAYDSNQQPSMEPFTLEFEVGDRIDTHVENHVKNTANDSSLKIILEKVEPEATWLSISPITPTVLEGVVPQDSVGKKYQLTLSANTRIGGCSSPITIPLQVKIDKKQTPRFKAENPQFPMLYPRQDFNYDFVAQRDITPEYEDAPYIIEFAQDSKHPYWLKLKNNKLFAAAKDIPEHINFIIKVHLVITNTPGGSSGKIPLQIMPADYTDELTFKDRA